MSKKTREKFTADELNIGGRNIYIQVKLKQTNIGEIEALSREVPGKQDLQIVPTSHGTTPEASQQVSPLYQQIHFPIIYTPNKNSFQHI